MTGIIHSKEAQPTILLVAVSGLAAGYRVEPAASMSKKNEGLPLASSDKGAVALYLKNSSSDTDARVANKLLIITKQTGKIRKKTYAARTNSAWTYGGCCISLTARRAGEVANIALSNAIAKFKKRSIK